MKKFVAALAIFGIMTMGLGNAMAFSTFNSLTGPVTDEDWAQMWNESKPVAHNPGWNNAVIGATPEEMASAYRNGDSVRPFHEFNTLTGPCTDEDWALLNSDSEGTAY